MRVAATRVAPDTGAMGNTWRRVAAIVIAAVSLAAPEAAHAQNAAERKPNIVLIVADDLGIGDISAYHPGHIPTPNIDALAKSGIRFTDAHVSAAVCAPSRAGLWTGRAGTRHGSEFNRGRGLSLDERNIGQLLKSSGYATGAIGKWHLGMKDGRDPLSRGFDEFFGLTSGSLHVNLLDPEAVNGYVATSEADLRTGERLRPVIRGNKPVKETQYLPEAFTREAVDFIGRHRDRPFFLYVGFNTPHAPVQTTRKYYERFPNIKNENDRIYAGMVSALDDGVGAILSKLREEGLERDTLVVFLSDNGGPMYLNDGPSNAPFAGWKRYHHEGGHRVPFVVKWPGQLAGGRTFDALSSALDLFPTFAAAAGATVPDDKPLDGVNLLPYLKGEKTDPPHKELYWRAAANFAVRSGKWKLVVANKAPVEQFLRISSEEAGGLLRDEPYFDISPLGQYVMLYDLDADQGETKNLAANHPDIVRDLRSKYDEWNRSNTAPNDLTGKAVPTVVDGVVLQLVF